MKNKVWNVLSKLNISRREKLQLEQSLQYLPGKFSKNPLDFSTLESLLNDLESNNNGGLFKFADRYRHTDSLHSSVYLSLINKMAEEFNIIPLGTQLNQYPDGKSIIKYHHDAHKIVGGVKEDFTVVLSLGATRTLKFRTNDYKTIIDVPLRNGDVAAFDTHVNFATKHGVLEEETDGPRISIALFGKQKNDGQNQMSTNVRGNESIAISNRELKDIFGNQIKRKRQENIEFEVEDDNQVNVVEKHHEKCFKHKYSYYNNSKRNQNSYQYYERYDNDKYNQRRSNYNHERRRYGGQHERYER